MKEKALKRYAHFISILLNIVCIVFGVLSVSLFAGIVVIVCARLFLPEMFRQAWETAVKAGQTLSFGQCAFFFICCLGMLICIFLALYNAKRLFGCIGKGNSPFTAETASQIRKIALYVLVLAVFSSSNRPKATAGRESPPSCRSAAACRSGRIFPRFPEALSPLR